MTIRGAVGIGVGALVLAAMPFASACNPPRVQSCRGPIGDFSGITGVGVTHALSPFVLGESSATVGFTLAAFTTSPSGDACVAIHAELRDGAGGVIETLDTPIHATVSGGFLQTSEILFYRSSSILPWTVVVTALGTTTQTEVTSAFSRDAFVAVPDAFVVRDAGRRSIDAGTDAALDDGPAPDDASIDDASMDDAGP